MRNRLIQSAIRSDLVFFAELRIIPNAYRFVPIEKYRRLPAQLISLPKILFANNERDLEELEERTSTLASRGGLISYGRIRSFPSRN
jgi:hypothetical protein